MSNEMNILEKIQESLWFSVLAAVLALWIASAQGAAILEMEECSDFDSHSRCSRSVHRYSCAALKLGLHSLQIRKCSLLSLLFLNNCTN